MKQLYPTRFLLASLCLFLVTFVNPFVIIAQTNNCPVTNPLTVSTEPNTEVAVPLQVSDADNDLLTIAVVQNPANGTLITDGDGGIFYTPQAGFTGSDFFIYSVTDGNCTVNDSVSFNVICSEHTVWEPGDMYTRSQAAWDQATDWSGLYNTVYADNGAVMRVGLPGTTGFSNLFTSTLAIKNYFVKSGTPGSLVGDNIDTTNDPSGVFGGEVVALRLNVDFSDANAFPANSNIALGDLVFYNMTEFTFQPWLSVPELNGKTVRELLLIADTLLGGGTSSTGLTISEVNNIVAEVNITFNEGDLGPFAQEHLTIPCSVDNTNSCPVTNPYSITTSGPFNLDLLSTDADGDALVHTIVQQASNGIGEMEDATLLFYNPNPGFVGTDFLIYLVSDSLCEVTDTVFITVECPSIESSGLETYSQASWGDPLSTAGLLLSANFSSLYLSSLPVYLSVGTSHSLSFTQNYGVFSYLPAGGTPGVLTTSIENPLSTSAGDFGGEVVALKLNLDFSDSGLLPGTVPLGDLLIHDFTDLPSVNGMTVREVYEMVSAVLGGSSASVSPTVASALANLINTSFVNGVPSDFALNYLAVPCDTTTTPVNQCPITTTSHDTIPENGSLGSDLSFFASDPDNDPLTFTVAPALHGTAFIVIDVLNYAPNAGYTGNDTILITASDGNCSVTDTIFVTVEPLPNNCPVVQGLEYTISSGTPLVINLSDFASDPDNDVLTFTVIPTAAGYTDIAQNILTFIPNPGFIGVETLLVNVADGLCETLVTVVVTVEPQPNNCPVANDATVTTPYNTPVLITLSYTDADNDPLSLLVLQPANGTAILTSGNYVTYTPAPGYSGTDQFMYTASDGICSDTGLVTITIAAPPVVVCPLSQGYWKNHHQLWNAAWMPMTLGTVSYTKQQLIMLLNKPVGNGNKADASLILVKQLIAAKLNILNGVVASQQVLDCIAAAEALIGASNLPMNVKVNTALGQQMVSVAACLEQFNLGYLNDGCTPALRVDEQSEESLGDHVIETVAPNPFTSTTTISYQLPYEMNVTIEVYNYLGQRIETLVNETQSGTHSVVFNAGNLPSGFYQIRMQAGEYTSTRKLVLMK
ncbi:MAG TPA: Ig-like domain-containing protein [Chitinophagales bacterium]|nr:Ig-like domain-containing protein [Chitinophagales bacterium]